MDPGEESFTLSSFDDFSSSFALYSSDEEEEELDQQRNYEDVDTYIELELGSGAAAQVESGDDELRISFSAVLVPFPGFFPSCSTAIINVSSKPTTTPEESTPTSPPMIKPRRFIGGNGTRLFPIASWTRFPPTSVDHHINGCRDLVPATRKVSTAAAVKGGIRKLLVKLRSVIVSGLGSMRASVLQQQPAASGRSWRLITSMKPFERWLALCKPPQRVAQVRRGTSTLKVTEMKLIETSTKKLFGSAVSQIKNTKRMNKSCPTSVKSSPVHCQLGGIGGDASLLNAAIAHCKKSFAQTDDFSF